MGETILRREKKRNNKSSSSKPAAVATTNTGQRNLQPTSAAVRPKKWHTVRQM
jgi:hypothetical protein